MKYLLYVIAIERVILDRVLKRDIQEYSQQWSHSIFVDILQHLVAADTVTTKSFTNPTRISQHKIQKGNSRR